MITEPAELESNNQLVPTLDTQFLDTTAGCSRVTNEKNLLGEKRALEDGEPSSKRLKDSNINSVSAVLVGSYGDSIKKEASKSALSKATRNGFALAIIKEELKDCNQK